MARVPAGSSGLPDAMRWRMDEASRVRLRELLAADPDKAQVREIENVVAEYLHARDALKDGADQSEVRAELRKFRKGLGVVVRFLDTVDYDRQPAIGAANTLLSHKLDFERLPETPGAALIDLAHAFDAAAEKAQTVKLSKASDPARLGHYADLHRAVERLSVTPTIRGYQGGRQGKDAEPWSPFVEFAFAVGCSVADHLGDARPIRNSGFPDMLRRAISVPGPRGTKSRKKARQSLS